MHHQNKHQIEYLCKYLSLALQHGHTTRFAMQASDRIELKINDPNKYFHRQDDATEASLIKSMVADEEQRVKKRRLVDVPETEALVDESLAFAVLDEMMSGASKDGEIEPDFGLPRNPVTGTFFSS